MQCSRESSSTISKHMTVEPQYKMAIPLPNISSFMKIYCFCRLGKGFNFHMIDDSLMRPK